MTLTLTLSLILTLTLNQVMQLQTYCDPLAILPRKMNRGAPDGGAFKFALAIVAGYYAWCVTLTRTLTLTRALTLTLTLTLPLPPLPLPLPLTRGDA